MLPSFLDKLKVPEKWSKFSSEQNFQELVNKSSFLLEKSYNNLQNLLVVAKTNPDSENERPLTKFIANYNNLPSSLKKRNGGKNFSSVATKHSGYYDDNNSSGDSEDENGAENSFHVPNLLCSTKDFVLQVDNGSLCAKNSQYYYLVRSKMTDKINL